jgi:hypothetical protein
VMAFVRIAGLLTLFALFGFIGLMHRRDRTVAAAARVALHEPQTEPR